MHKAVNASAVICDFCRPQYDMEQLRAKDVIRDTRDWRTCRDIIDMVRTEDARRPGKVVPWSALTCTGSVENGRLWWAMLVSIHCARVLLLGRIRQQ